MANDALTYRAMFQALAPTGLVWPKDEDSEQTKLFHGLAEEWARVDSRLDDLIAESLPTETLEMLSDWERVAGLPGDCSYDSETVAARRAALVSKLTRRGGQHKAYYISIAEDLGFENCTITEFAPMTCEDSCGDALLDEDWVFVWRMNVPGEFPIYTMTCEDDCESPLRWWGTDKLFCFLDPLKPAHTLLLMNYSSESGDATSRPDGAFSMAFSRDFDTVKAADIPRAGAFSSAFGRDFDIKRRGAFSQAFSADFDTLS